MSIKALRQLIREVLLSEIDSSQLADVCYTAGSTHVMKTCRIGRDKYFLKYSDDDLFEEGFDPSLQILIEYLAYRIYGLYAGIKIPSVELVYDAPNKKVGIATSPLPGKQALKVGMKPQTIGKMMSQGVYVDIFLANWDVIGTGSGNVFVDDEIAYHLDPGGSLTFRAQGGRKGKTFNSKVGELRTMLSSGRGAAVYFQHADLETAAEEFLSVPWPRIESEIDTVRNEIAEDLENRHMERLLSQWQSDCDEIKSTLSQRYKEVEEHARHILSGG